MKFVRIAATKPNVLKLISNELHNASPIMIGNRDNFVQKPVYSPIRNLEINTVNIGDELFTVSTNDMVACLRAINPRTIENNLELQR